MPSQTKENYLKTLYFLDRENERISISDVSKEMEVSIPTVNSMVKKLQEKGWVIYKKYKPLRLTASGRKMAALIVRKHRLSEMFLSKIMGFGWEEVHDIAEELEHINTDQLFDRMDELLGNPTIDPHGSPIPDKNGKVPVREYQQLSEVDEGKRVRVCALKDSSTDFLMYLNGKNIRLGTEMDVLKKEPFDRSVSVTYGNALSVNLSNEVGERLLVELIN